MDLIKFIKKNLKIDIRNKLLDDIKIGLFIGVTISSIVVFFFKIFGMGNLLLIILLYFYPITGVLVAYFVKRSKKEKIISIERGYHG